MKSVLIILANERYQDIEYSGTRKALEAAGFFIVVGSKEAGECTGKFGGTEQATVALRDVQAGEYDCIAFIGGPGASAYFDDPEAHALVTGVTNAGIPLGAICIAPVILAKAGVLNGKKATVWNDDGKQSDILSQYGAIYTGETVTTDGLIVTGNGPDAAEEFGRALAHLSA